MKYSTLLNIVKRIREKATLQGVSSEKKLGLHQFRRASITHEANKGRPIAHVCMEKWGKPYSPMIERYMKPGEDDISSSKMEMLGIEKRKYVKRKTAMMPTQCQACGFVNAPGIEFCGKCGHGLNEVAEISRRMAHSELISDPDVVRGMIEEAVQAEMEKRRKQ